MRDRVPSETRIAVITGYNTDVEYNGVVYHVQTEDKGLQTPEIVSLVFVKGAILARKRSEYGDLVMSGFDEDALAKRLQRQHKLICAAVHAGRIEDLKRMSERDAAQVSSPDTTSPAPATAKPEAEAPATAEDLPVIQAGLAVRLVEARNLRGGDSVILQLLVTRDGRAALRPVAVTVKTIGTSFSSNAVQVMTDEHGRASVPVTIPKFKSGRAAILVRAELDGETAETRRIIHPSPS